MGGGSEGCLWSDSVSFCEFPVDVAKGKEQVGDILILVYPYIHGHRCVLALYNQYFTDLREEKSKANYLLGFKPQTFATPEQCLTN